MPNLARPMRSAAVRSASEPSAAHDAELRHLRTDISPSKLARAAVAFRKATERWKAGIQSSTYRTG